MTQCFAGESAIYRSYSLSSASSSYRCIRVYYPPRGRGKQKKMIDPVFWKIGTNKYTRTHTRIRDILGSWCKTRIQIARSLSLSFIPLLTMARNKPKLLQIFVNPANVRDSPCVASSRGAERIQRQMKLRQEKFIVYEATVMLLLNIKKKYIYIYT